MKPSQEDLKQLHQEAFKRLQGMQRDQLLLNRDRCEHAFIWSSHGGGTDIFRCSNPNGHKGQHQAKCDGQHVTWETGDSADTTRYFKDE